MAHTPYAPAPDCRPGMNERIPLIRADFDAAWARFLTNHRNAGRHFTDAHDLLVNDNGAAPAALAHWRACWRQIERRIWAKHERAVYLSLPTPVPCPNPACAHPDNARAFCFCEMCGVPIEQNITRGGVKPGRRRAA